MPGYGAGHTQATPLEKKGTVKMARVYDRHVRDLGLQTHVAPAKPETRDYIIVLAGILAGAVIVGVARIVMGV